NQRSAVLLITTLILVASARPPVPGASGSIKPQNSPLTELPLPPGEFQAAKTDPAAMSRLQETIPALPMSFERNEEITDRRVKFLSHGRGYSLFLTANEAVLELNRAAAIEDRPARAPRRKIARPPSLPGEVMRMRLIGANPRPKVEGIDPLPGTNSY